MYSKNLQAFMGKIFEICGSIWNPKVLCQHKVLLLSLWVIQRTGLHRIQESRGPSHVLSFLAHCLGNLQWAWGWSVISPSTPISCDAAGDSRVRTG